MRLAFLLLLTPSLAWGFCDEEPFPCFDPCIDICDTSLPYPGTQLFCTDPSANTAYQLTTCADLGLYDPDPDSDGVLHPSDNCPLVYNPAQTDLDQNGEGDACQHTLTSDAAAVESYCSEDYSHIDDCANVDAPQPPILDRAVSTADRDFHASTMQATCEGVSLPIDQTTSTWPKGPQVAGTHQPTGHTRASNDGRVHVHSSGSRPLVSIFRPEALDYNLTVKPGEAPRGGAGQLSLAAMHDPDNTRINHAAYGNWAAPPAYHTTICDDSGAAAAPGAELSMERNPRPCDATLDGVVVEGDCYDLTFLHGIQSFMDPVNEIDPRWELRSTDATVFVADPKSEYASIHRGQDNMAIYPQTSATSLGPPIYWHVPAQVEDFRTHCSANPGTDWCAWLDAQSWQSQPFMLDDNIQDSDPGELWDGSNHGGAKMRDGFPFGGLSLFELTTTSDGRVLILNTMRGIYYSVHETGTCSADGFRVFKPMSQFPNDPLVAHYDLARASVPYNGLRAFRDANNEIIEPGERLIGAYPWVDRQGKNLIWAQVNKNRDGWHAVSQQPAQDGLAELSLNPDQGAGKGVAVLGAWTQGKIVQLDNMLNPTDWASERTATWHDNACWSGGRKLNYTFQMSLYQGAARWIRPKGRTLIFSMENQFYGYDHMSPVLPYDVVWNVSSNAQFEAELAFDEYMRNDAFVVAHMNASTYEIEIGGRPEIMPRDGFLPPNATVVNGVSTVSTPHTNRGNYAVRESPRLQNATTANRHFDPTAIEGPKTLRLRGGARVEPVALGGVRGKGVYLDGQNDFIDMGFENTDHHDWYLGVWFDNRAEHPGQMARLFTWPDGSWLGVSGNQVQLYNSNSALTNRYQTIDIRNLGLQASEWHHYGVKVTHTGTERRVQVFIDGDPTPVGVVSWPAQGADRTQHGFSMDIDHMNGWSWFVVGDPGPDFVTVPYGSPLPLQGWVDELRIYALDAEEVAGNYFDEFACNLALGTLREEEVSPVREESPVLRTSSTTKRSLTTERETYASRTLQTIEPDVVTRRWCEQLQLTSHDTPLEMGPQVGFGVCVDKVHKNPDAVTSDAETCVREEVLEFEHIPQHAGVPRGDFTGVPFCLSCHVDQHPVPGLGLQALTPGSVPRELDARRQPMLWPAINSGCDLDQAPFPITATCDPSGTGELLLDPIIDYLGKMTP